MEVEGSSGEASNYYYSYLFSSTSTWFGFVFTPTHDSVGPTYRAVWWRPVESYYSLHVDYTAAKAREDIVDRRPSYVQANPCRVDGPEENIPSRCRMNESGRFGRIWPLERAGESGERASGRVTAWRERERERDGRCPATTTTMCCGWEEGAAASAGPGDKRGGDGEADACPATTTTMCCGQEEGAAAIAVQSTQIQTSNGIATKH
uniref:Uncharacterized protein n=1 Tax=Oryza nivara TaxID=4536 RepID=A0A0E0IFC7_ORYNI